MDLVCACDGLSPLPVQGKAISWIWFARAMGFLPAYRGKGSIMVLVCACDGPFPLPVEEKAVSWTWCAFVMVFPLCLSRKRPLHGLGVRLRWAFPPARRGKGRITVLMCACDGLSPLPVEEMVVSWTRSALAMGFSLLPPPLLLQLLLLLLLHPAWPSTALDYLF